MNSGAINVQDYVTVGAGGISFLTLIGFIWYFIKNIAPILRSIETESRAHQELARNSAQAIQEVAKSNENVANALHMLKNSFESLNTSIERHDERAENISHEIMKISERTTACVRR